MLDLREIAPEVPRPLRREEYEQLVASGAFEDERVELLYGVIVRMSPHGPPHDAALDRLTELFVRAIGSRAKVRVQSAFAAGDGSEPEPDVAIVPRKEYDEAHPSSAYLVVEVAASSIHKDRGLKSRLYAESGVPEYWVVNVIDREIEVHTAPSGGAYSSRAVFPKGASIVLGEFTDVHVRVDDILP